MGLAPQAGFEPATLRLTGGKNELSRALPPFAGRCRTVRQPSKNLAVFRFRLMPGFAALCRSLLLPKGKKRATSQLKPRGGNHHTIRRVRSNESAFSSDVAKLY
jgi:hypothetical protein